MHKYLVKAVKQEGGYTPILYVVVKTACITVYRLNKNHKMSTSPICLSILPKLAVQAAELNGLRYVGYVNCWAVL